MAGSIENPFINVLQVAVEPENKKTILLSLEYLKYTERFTYRNGKSSFSILSEELRPLHLTFAMKPFSPFYEKFDETIQRLCQGGFCPERLAMLHPRQILYKDRNMENDKIPPLVLSMDDLGIGFVVCSIPLTFSVIVFVAEVFTNKTKKMIQSLNDYIVAYVVMKSFFYFRIHYDFSCSGLKN